MLRVCLIISVRMCGLLNNNTLFSSSNDVFCWPNWVEDHNQESYIANDAGAWSERMPVCTIAI